MQSSIPKIKWHSLFISPGIEGIVNEFTEISSSYSKPSESDLISVIRGSFEVAGIPVTEVNLTPSCNSCNVKIAVKDIVYVVSISIKTMPSLEIDGACYKLEEFDF